MSKAFFNIASGISALGGLGAGIIANGASGHKAHDLAILQFGLQQKLAEYTGTHAHQWEIKDLRDAGLNPVLSANSGNTYSSGSFSTPFSGYDNPVDSGKNALDAMLNVRSTIANLENMSANTQKQKTESSLLEEQTRTQAALTRLNNANADIAEIDKKLDDITLKYAEKEKLLQMRKEATFIAHMNQEILKIGSERELLYNQMSLNNAEKAFKNQSIMESKSREWRNWHSPLGYGHTERGINHWIPYNKVVTYQ